MDRGKTAYAAWIFAAAAFFPAVTITASLCGLDAELFNYPICSLITALLTIVFSAPLLRSRSELGKAARLLTALLPIASAVNWMLYVSLGTQENSPPLNFVTCLSAAACFGISAALVIKRFSKPSVKALVLVIPCILCFLLLILSFFGILLGSFGKTEVVRTEPSPNGRYIAEIIDDDQGALGGNTFVNVRRNINVDLGIVKLSGKLKNVWNGGYGEFNDMTLEWKDDETLLINGREYTIK
ncbi:MAG: DUF5412 domain-containing protein [Clostridiales bacterium]|nr:DUF5412 domain-containing protein [Clostridiales bacterium]